MRWAVSVSKLKTVLYLAQRLNNPDSEAVLLSVFFAGFRP
jgi:hypothetical protein